MNRNLFNSIQLTRPKSNRFDLTHDVKLSCKMGELVPIMVEECVPGDRFRIGCESLIRFAPLVAPVMHRFDVTMHYFFVPNRLVWNGWEDFITGKGGTFPTITYNDGGFPQYTDLCDYMGLPTPIAAAAAETVSAIPFAAYQAIYNEYYRDQNLQAEVDFNLVDGNQPSLSVNNWLWPLRRRAWEHDYFTSALPWAQKGDPVDIPLGDVNLKTDWETQGLIPHFEENGGTPVDTGDVIADAATTDIHTSASADKIAYDPNGSMEVEPTTINTLRRAFRLQEWLEKQARGGSRYIESILAHFGVRSSDKRLQRPEYITGIKTPVQISEVLNTAGNDALSLPQGNMAGHGVSYVQGNYGSYFCEEHGYIIGIMSVMPKTAYQQGIPKHYLKYSDPYQYYWPEFAHIGEQEVLNKEVYSFQGATGDDTFGYVPRYAEYRYANNRVAGEFKTTLDFWHAGRIFATPPALNSTFIQCDPDTRIFAVETGDHLFCQVVNHVQAVRPMPKFGTPQF